MLVSADKIRYNKLVIHTEGGRGMAAKEAKRWARRLIFALAPCLLLCFMYCVWGPMEVFVGNAANFRFQYHDAFWPLLQIMGIAAVALTLIVSLFRRRAYRVILAVVFMLALCSYIQNNFLNLDLGLLEGEGVDWKQYTTHGWINLAVWIVLLAGGIVLLLKLRARTARRLIALASVVLLLVQGVTFGVVTYRHLTSDASRSREESSYVLNGREQFNVSAEGNVIVFLLDYFSNDYVDAAEKAYPGLLTPFHDFTYYDNCDSTYIGTFPSVVHLLTGNPFDNTIPIDTWFDQSWNGADSEYFFNTLKENGYKFNFFDSSNTYFGLQYAGDKVSNIHEIPGDSYIVYTPNLVKRLLRLSLYRYFPHALKQYFYQPSNVFNEMVNMYLGGAVICHNSISFYNLLNQKHLTPISGDGKYFIIQFLRGTHPPYQVNDVPEWDENATLEQCAAGNLKMVAAYLDELKAQGLYDSSTIIITSDHGDKENSMQVLYFIKEAGVTRDKMAVSSAPITHIEFQGTILRNIGADTNGRTTIYDFADGEKRVRTVMRNYIDTNYPYVRKYHSTAQGTHTVMYVYSYQGDRKALRKQVRRGPTEILPLTECFN